MNKKIQTFWDLAQNNSVAVKLQDKWGIHLDDRVPTSEVNLHRTTLKSKLKPLDQVLMMCSFNGKL